jgi:glycine/D-amino acid oxidase-like deaminating enzyme
MFDSAARSARVEQEFRGLYPGLNDLALERSWSGPVDRSFDGLPRLGAFPGHENILYGIGWSGNGLGPSRIGARILASLALDKRDCWTDLPIVGPPLRNLPPEPIRYFGSKMVRAGVDAKDQAEMAGRKPAWLACRLADLAPRGVEDH